MAKRKYSDNTMLARMWRNWITYTLPAGISNDTAVLENNVAISYKTKYAITMQPGDSILAYLSQKN